MQELGLPLQLNPASTRQKPSQPSPLVAFPSSHDSPASTMPFPHVLEQALPAVGQRHPASVRHEALQPSPGAVLPSSHCSLPARMPSPHTVLQLLGEPAHA